MPILDEANVGLPLGVLVFRIDPATYLYPFIKRWPIPSLTAETLLVRREGNEVVFLNELRFREDAALNLRAPLEQMAMPAARAALGQEGVMEGSDYRGVPVVAALRAIPDSPWFLVARMDIAEAYAPLRERLWQIVALISVLLLGTGAGIALLWRQQRVSYYRTKYEARAAQAKLAAIVESAEDAIISKNLDGTITSWNAAAEQLFGYPAAEMIGHNIDRIIPSTELPVEAEILQRLRRGESIEHFETVRLAKDGHSIPVSLTISPLLDAAGAIIGAAKIVRDITERKRAAEALRESEEQFRAMFERASVGIAQADPGTGHWIRVNEKMCAITGYSVEELLRMRISEITHPDDRQSDGEAYQRVVRGEQPDYRLEKRYLRKDGSLAWVNVNMTIIRDAAGQPARTVATIEDITERKQAEVALHESEKRFRSLAVATSQIIWSTDAQGQVCGPMPSFQAYTGQSDEEIRGSGWASTLHPDDVERTIKVWQEAVAAKAGYLTEYRLRRCDGVYRYFTARGAPVVTDDGRILEWIGTCSDITERKQAEDKLRESEARFRKVFEMAPLPLCHVTKDGVIAFRNERFAQVFGYTADEVPTLAEWWREPIPTRTTASG